jgi:hypothetical protein
MLLWSDPTMGTGLRRCGRKTVWAEKPVWTEKPVGTKKEVGSGSRFDENDG